MKDDAIRDTTGVSAAQYLRTTTIGNMVYYDEGNGNAQLLRATLADTRPH
jgi:hypothetical protein